MPLTRDQVDTISGELISRANAAISNLQSQLSSIPIANNNDTVNQSIGALQTVIGDLQPAWINRGYALADAVAAGNETNIDPVTADTSLNPLYQNLTYGTEINVWKDVGTVAQNSIAAIDGYGESASLQAVIGQTATATVQQVEQGIKQAAGDLAVAIPWYVYAGAFALVIGIGYLVIKSSPKISVGV